MNNMIGRVSGKNLAKVIGYVLGVMAC